MLEILDLLKAYKEFGYFVLLVAVVYFFYRELQSSKREMVEAKEAAKSEVLSITVTATKALDASSAAMVHNAQQMQGVKESADSMNRTVGELVAVIKDRDLRDSIRRQP